MTKKVQRKTVSELPDKLNFSEIEKKWRARWEEDGIYRWNSDRPRSETYVVDTPPPTVSGSLHIGHVFSFTQTDVIVRYQRMCGKNIFYPIGWDDNGLATERRVQNVFDIRCEVDKAYQPEWKPEGVEHISLLASKSVSKTIPTVPAVPANGEDTTTVVSRQNFIEACQLLTKEDEKIYEHIWRRIGLSVDWQLQYATIDDHCRKISQLSFLDLVNRGYVYSEESPTMWDVDFQTAVAQAEVEDRESVGHFYDIVFKVEEREDYESGNGGTNFIISTTRPELLAACIAVVAHPDDQRYQDLFGKYAITPLFNVRVPILPAVHADPSKGTGILMVCTFGDVMDVEWWKHSDQPIRQIIGRDGKMLDIKFVNATEGASTAFVSLFPQEANHHYSKLVGHSVKSAKKIMAKLLAETPGILAAPARETKQAVKYYEKGERPLEFISTRQWFIKILEHRDQLLEQGEKIKWHPEHMRVRYEHWVRGINQDWCISRQRYFGVPFPVWYHIDQAGNCDYQNPIFADNAMLPVDPMIAVPPGYTEGQRNLPGGFCADKDVMDTWATSSMTPQIVSHWQLNPQRHQKLFPMDLRPQSHEIIRTWAFYTIVKAYYHQQTIPWEQVAISGWVLDPDRKKMSKSKGKVITPENFIDTYSADAVRYWSAKARLGVDTAFEEGQFKIGQKLVTKIFNAAKFIFGIFEHNKYNDASEVSKLKETNKEITEPLDLIWLELLNQAVVKSSDYFNLLDYAGALQITEETFWAFCDHYLELIKVRAYGGKGAGEQIEASQSQGVRSALVTLEFSLHTFLKLFAPFFPYVTEEIWSWSCVCVKDQQTAAPVDSVHSSTWPTPLPLPTEINSDFAQSTFRQVVEIISAIRGAKTAQKRNMRWRVKKLTLGHSAEIRESLQAFLPDICNAGNVAQVEWSEVEVAGLQELRVAVELDTAETN
ncbi:MAG: valine--tRNA ligase [Oligoflexia bacterium]|nr:valine--tRNA ligase [Oligoflexia bacterium]